MVQQSLGGCWYLRWKSARVSIGRSSYFLFVIFAQSFKCLLSSCSSNGDPKCLNYSLIPFLKLSPKTKVWDLKDCTEVSVLLPGYADVQIHNTLPETTNTNVFARKLEGCAFSNRCIVLEGAREGLVWMLGFKYEAS